MAESEEASMPLSSEEIHRIYDMLAQYHRAYLAQAGVALPALQRGDAYTKDALTLVYLARDYPDTHVVSKEELTAFIRQYYPGTNDVQQARHLAAQKGWYIESGTRGDLASRELKAGEYRLKTLTEHYPGFTALRRQAEEGDWWEKLKEEYGYCCACCGSREGEPHRYWKNTITRLQMGHMDPRRPLGPDNTIPQCEKCNRPDRNYWIYDKKGRVTGLASAAPVLRSSAAVQREIWEQLKRKFGE